MITKRGALGYFSRATPAPHLRHLATIGVSVWFCDMYIQRDCIQHMHNVVVLFLETTMFLPASQLCRTRTVLKPGWQPHKTTPAYWSRLHGILPVENSCSLDSKDWVHSKLEETEQTGNAWKQPRSRATFGEGSQPSEPEVLPKLTDPVEITQRWEELMSTDPEHLGRDNANALQNCQQQKNYTIWCKRSGQVDTCICLFTHCNYTVLYASYVYMPCFLHTTNRYS